MCNDWRQEYILLSDVLGVTMLVDSINHRRPSGATPNTILGPFYLEGAPHYPNGADICLDHKGEPTLVRGRILDIDGNPVAGATIDVWQTNDDGFYDVQQKACSRNTICAASSPRRRTGATGSAPSSRASTRSRMMALSASCLSDLDRHPNRAAHMHFIVMAPGFDQVITHIFTPDCPYLKEDTVFGVKKDLVATFKTVDDPVLAAEYGMPCPFLLVDWDFVLARTA